MQGVAFHVGNDLVCGRGLAWHLEGLDVDLVQMARAIEQPVQGAAIRHAGVGAVAQFVIAVREAALQFLAGLACGIAESLQGLGLAEQLAQGVIGKGQVGGGVAGLGQAAQGVVAVGGFFHGAGVAQGALGQQTAQGIALEAGDLAGPGVAATGFDDVGQFTGGVVDVALPAVVEICRFLQVS